MLAFSTYLQQRVSGGLGPHEPGGGAQLAGQLRQIGGGVKERMRDAVPLQIMRDEAEGSPCVFCIQIKL